MSEGKDVFWREWMQAGIALLLGNRRDPTLDEAAAAAKRAIARGALELEGGNVSRASERVQTSRRTLNRAANDTTVPLVSPMWHHDQMAAPMDDTLFPFVRVKWPAGGHGQFAQELLDWWLAEVFPRADAEQTQIVELQNFSGLGALPPIGIVPALMSRKNEFLPLAKSRIVGTVIYSPGLSLTSLLSPVINVAPGAVKVATTDTAAIGFAETMFADAGMDIPPALAVE
ncbi:MAG: hypothetical protein KDK70_21785 [Myxococcales bacterium]|nr:hypothetical protein [Myxococcales bacterium]